LPTNSAHCLRPEAGRERFIPAQDKPFIKPLCCRFLKPREHMAVGMEGSRDVGVAQPLLDYLGINPLL